MTTTDTMQALVRQAINDPGSIVGPRQVVDDGWDTPQYESISNWSARAVMRLLEDPSARAASPVLFDRTRLARIVRVAWVRAVRELVDNPKDTWVAGYDYIDPFQKEADARIGEAVTAFVLDELALAEVQPSAEQLLRAMHTALGIHAGWMPGTPTDDLPPGLPELRWQLIDEEVNRELRPAMIAGDLIAIADACADAVVTIVGTAISYGLPFDALLREVMRSNMTKTNPTGRKLAKGPDYSPPDIMGVLDAAVENQ